MSKFQKHTVSTISIHSGHNYHPWVNFEEEWKKWMKEEGRRKVMISWVDSIPNPGASRAHANHISRRCKQRSLGAGILIADIPFDAHMRLHMIPLRRQHALIAPCPLQVVFWIWFGCRYTCCSKVSQTNEPKWHHSAFDCQVFKNSLLPLLVGTVIQMTQNIAN